MGKDTTDLIDKLGEALETAKPSTRARMVKIVVGVLDAEISAAPSGASGDHQRWSLDYARRLLLASSTTEKLVAALVAELVGTLSEGDISRSEKEEPIPAQNSAANAARSVRAAAFAAQHRPEIQRLRGLGWSLSEVSDHMSALHPAPRGGSGWSKMSIKRIAASE